MKYSYKFTEQSKNRVRTPQVVNTRLFVKQYLSYLKENNSEFKYGDHYFMKFLAFNPLISPEVFDT